MASFSMALRAESIGAARFTNDFWVESLAGHAAPPSSPPDPPLDELDVNPLEEAAPLEFSPDEPPVEPSWPSDAVPDEPLLDEPLPPDPPLVPPPFELVVDGDWKPVPGSPVDAVVQCARARPKPRPRTTTTDRWVNFIIVPNWVRLGSSRPRPSDGRFS